MKRRTWLGLAAVPVVAAVTGAGRGIGRAEQFAAPAGERPLIGLERPAAGRREPGQVRRHVGVHHARLPGALQGRFKRPHGR